MYYIHSFHITYVLYVYITNNIFSGGRLNDKGLPANNYGRYRHYCDQVQLPQLRFNNKIHSGCTYTHVMIQIVVHSYTMLYVDSGHTYTHVTIRIVLHSYTILGWKTMTAGHLCEQLHE